MMRKTGNNSTSAAAQSVARRRLAGYAEACDTTYQCTALFQCCEKIGEDGGGLCYYKCDQKKGEYCDENTRCGPDLGCCKNQCTDKGLACRADFYPQAVDVAASNYINQNVYYPNYNN